MGGAARPSVATAAATACLLTLVWLSACSSNSPSSTSGQSANSGLCVQAQRLATATQTSGGSTADFAAVQAAIARERDVAATLIPLTPAGYQADAVALHNALVQAAQTVSKPPPANDSQAAIAMYEAVAGYFTRIESNLTHLGNYLRSTCHLNINLGVGSTTTVLPGGG